MSTNTSFYIGPFIEVPNYFDWEEWEFIVSCRSEGHCELKKPLIANSKVDGIDRELDFDPYSELDIHEIETSTISDEKLYFKSFAQDLIRHLEESGIDFEVKWGIVPYIY
tara:strand:- start:31892 stop:32221 length:330 start_codon:yes stop_codon:yes gene_type:complete